MHRLDILNKIRKSNPKTDIGRMDQGEAVRKQEFNQLRTDIGSQLSDIQVENRSQNKTKNEA